MCTASFIPRAVRRSKPIHLKSLHHCSRRVSPLVLHIEAFTKTHARACWLFLLPPLFFTDVWEQVGLSNLQPDGWGQRSAAFLHARSWKHCGNLGLEEAATWRFPIRTHLLVNEPGKSVSEGRTGRRPLPQTHTHTHSLVGVSHVTVLFHHIHILCGYLGHSDARVHTLLLGWCLTCV